MHAASLHPSPWVTRLVITEKREVGEMGEKCPPPLRHLEINKFIHDCQGWVSKKARKHRPRKKSLFALVVDPKKTLHKPRHEDKILEKHTLLFVSCRQNTHST